MTQTQPGHSPTAELPPGTGRPTWPGRSTATPRHCGSAPPRPPRSQYARTQNNLGTAYRVLPTGDRAANLAGRSTAHTEALRFHTAEAAPARVRHDPEQPGHRLRRASHRGPGGQPGARRSTATPRHCGSSPPRRLPPCTASRPSTSVISISSRAAGRRHTPPSPRPSAPASSSIRPPAQKPAGRLNWGRPGMRWPPTRTAWPGSADSPRRCSAWRPDGPVPWARRSPGTARRLEEASEADRAAFVAAADRIKALEAEGRRGQDTEAPAGAGEAILCRAVRRTRPGTGGPRPGYSAHPGVPARVHGRGA